MEVVEAQATRVNWLCYARVTTDEGIYRIDESGALGATDAVTVQIRSSSLYLAGRNPLDIKHHWQVTSRGMFFRGATVMGILFATDVALWDTAGKYYNAPVYQLMDGKYRDKVLVYDHITASGDEELVKSCKKRKEQGFEALGHLSPFLDEDEDTPYNRTYAKNIKDVIRYTHSMWETAGDDVDLCIELRRRSLPAGAVALIQKIADVHPLFAEDPIPSGSNGATVYIMWHNKVLAAARERLYTIYEFQDLLDRQVANHIRVGPITVGGLTGVKKITTLVESKTCPIVPYNPLSPACIAIEMQLCARTGSLLICEYLSGDDRLSWDSTSIDRKCDMMTNWDKPVDGYITPSFAPGIGIDLIPDIEGHSPSIIYAPGSRLNIDGSVRDQQSVSSYPKGDKL